MLKYRDSAKNTWKTKTGRLTSVNKSGIRFNGVRIALRDIDKNEFPHLYKENNREAILKDIADQKRRIANQQKAQASLLYKEVSNEIWAEAGYVYSRSLKKWVSKEQVLNALLKKKQLEISEGVSEEEKMKILKANGFQKLEDHRWVDSTLTSEPKTKTQESIMTKPIQGTAYETTKKTFHIIVEGEWEDILQNETNIWPHTIKADKSEDSLFIVNRQSKSIIIGFSGDISQEDKLFVLRVLKGEINLTNERMELELNRISKQAGVDTKITVTDTKVETIYGVKAINYTYTMNKVLKDKEERLVTTSTMILEKDKKMYTLVIVTTNLKQSDHMAHEKKIFKSFQFGPAPIQKKVEEKDPLDDEGTEEIK